MGQRPTNLSTLNAEQVYQQTHIALVQALATRYADTAALFQALGGGWWNREDPAVVAESGKNTVASPPVGEGGAPVLTK